jgi:hypothetical protein
MRTAHGQDRRHLSTPGLVSLILGECFASSCISRLLRHTISFSRPLFEPVMLSSSASGAGRPTTSLSSELHTGDQRASPAVHGERPGRAQYLAQPITTGTWKDRVAAKSQMPAATPSNDASSYKPPLCSTRWACPWGRHRGVWSSTMLACHNISIIAVGNGSAVVRPRDRLLASSGGLRRAELLPMVLDRNC